MSIFSTSIETREVHKNENLRTHYYKNNFKDVRKAVEKMVNEEDLQLYDVNERFGDILVCGDGFEIIFSVIQINPIETSVDLKINYFVTIGWNRPLKKAIHVFEYLDSHLNFKGQMLHPNAA